MLKNKIYIRKLTIFGAEEDLLKAVELLLVLAAHGLLRALAGRAPRGQTTAMQPQLAFRFYSPSIAKHRTLTKRRRRRRFVDNNNNNKKTLTLTNKSLVADAPEGLCALGARELDTVKAGLDKRVAGTVACARSTAPTATPTAAATQTERRDGVCCVGAVHVRRLVTGNGGTAAHASSADAAAAATTTGV